MKKLLIPALITLIVCSAVLAETPENSPWNIQADVDRFAGTTIGVRYDMNDKLSLVTGFGLNPLYPTHYCYTLYASITTMEIYDTWNVGVNVGILQGLFDNTSAPENQFLYINPGLTMYVTYPIIENLRLGAQGGMVLLFGHDQYGWASSLEPYIGLSLIYSEK